MSAAQRMASKVRTVPLVFKLSAVLLIVAVAAGELTQHHIAGRVSLLMLATVTHSCPTALPHETRPTVLDAELAADRATRWLIADRLLPHSEARCDMTVTSEPSARIWPTHRRMHHRHHR